jgi:hypothetical protein
MAVLGDIRAPTNVAGELVEVTPHLVREAQGLGVAGA